MSIYLAFMGLPGGVEWLVVLVIALLLFGRRLPEVMRGLGGGAREFRKGLTEGEAAPRKGLEASASNQRLSEGQEP